MSEKWKDRERERDIYYITPPNVVNFQFINESLYSSTPHKESQIMTNIIKVFFRKHYRMCDITAIDATAHIGCDTITFMRNFGRVVAVEENTNTFKILSSNVKDEQNVKNLTLLNESFLDTLHRLQDISIEYKTTFVYIDAPWGGLDYRYKSNIDLYLDNINIIDIADRLLKLVRLVVIKVPKNFNIEYIKKYDKQKFIKQDIYRKHKISYVVYYLFKK